MAVVLPAYFVPKEGERLCMTTRGKDEGARAGGRVSGANIPFLHSHLLMHTHTHACMHAQTHSQEQEALRKCAHGSTTSHVIGNS